MKKTKIEKTKKMRRDKAYLVLILLYMGMDVISVAKITKMSRQGIYYILNHYKLDEMGVEMKKVKSISSKLQVEAVKSATTYIANETLEIE